MTYKTKEQFIRDYTLGRLGLVDYIKNLETKGLDDTDIQVELLKNKIVKTPRTLVDSWRFYNSVRNMIAW
ncbi:MAG: hypothetical protein HOI55_04100 [Candidatus Marinimicrobia bacterium]|jgi:predicted glycosyltransferase|nr:hypothetical protein [Candidatus Neomarinimicrobiota bacterium]